MAKKSNRSNYQQYDDQFCKKMLKIYHQKHPSIRHLSNQFDIPESILHTWITIENLTREKTAKPKGGSKSKISKNIKYYISSLI